jgi:Protein of unknown function, DUF547
MNLRAALVAAFTFVVAAPLAHADISHAKLGTVLSKYVSGGKVDYVGLRADQADLDEYLKSVASASGDLKMAFYINAYNALVLKAIVKQDPLPKNVTDDKAFFDKTKYKVAGKDMTLNEIEGKIRKEFKDARIHFAFNCGARSCPPLPGTPFDDKTIDATLTKLTQNFLNANGVKIDDAKKEIQVTKLMDWYGTDFAETLKDPAMSKDKAATEFAKIYITDAKKKAAFEAAVTAGYKVTYQGYNWNPNAK